MSDKNNKQKEQSAINKKINFSLQSNNIENKNLKELMEKGAINSAQSTSNKEGE